MKQLLRSRRFLAFLVIASAAVYLWASSPNKVSIRTDGSIIGFQNNIRAVFQGEHFWVDQKYLTYSERETLRQQPANDRKLRADVDRINQESQQSMEKFYRENPNTRPSVATLQADALRNMAERVEEAEMWRLLDEHRRERIQELEQIQNITDQRLKQRARAPE